MTILSACNKAALRLRGKKVVSIVSTTDQFSMELCDLANETARAVSEEHDWQALTKLCTLNGTGSVSNFTLPADFDRMLKKGEVRSPNWQTARFAQARDLDQWAAFEASAIAGTPGRWIVFGGEMKILPAMSASESAQFYYISRNVSKAGKPEFDSDGDEFVLDERLITLGVIWRWRAQKRLEYAEDMQNFEIAQSQAIAKDRSQRPLVIGSQRLPGNVELAFPGTIVP